MYERGPGDACSAGPKRVVKRPAGAFDGLEVLVPERHRDERGFLSEVYNRERLAELGIRDEFVQANHIGSVGHVVRGLHFQTPPHETAKLVRVTRGAIFDVAVDLRVDSQTFGDYHAIELSEQNWTQVYVPRGFAHGYLTVSDESDVSYLVTDHWSAEWDAGIKWDDPELDIEWPVVRDAVVSAKDQSQPSWAEFAATVGLA